MAVKYLSGNRVTALSTDLVSETTTELGYTGSSQGHSNSIHYKRFSATAGQKITKIGCRIYSCSDTKFKGGVYTDNGASDGSGQTGTARPQTLLSQGEITGVSTSGANLWVEVDVDCTVPSDGLFWVGFISDDNSTNWYRDSGNSLASGGVYGSDCTPSGRWSNYANMMYSTANYGNGNNNQVSGNNMNYRYTISSPKLGTTDATANVTDDLTTDKGWSSNSSDWAYNTSDYLYFNPIRRNTTSQDMYIDLQDSDYLGSGNNLHASKWVVRLGKFETVSLAGGNADFYFGVSDGTGDDSSTQQSVYFALNGNSSDAQISGAATTGNMNGSGRTYGSFSPTITNSASNELWLEMIRDSDNYTLNYYSDEYSTLASTATIAKSGISNLRYIKFTNDSEATSSYTWVAKLHGAIKIYNGITAVTSDSAVNAQTNTIAEETDTGIHRIWSGSAWVEVA